MMITRLFLIFVVVIIFLALYKVSCEQEKAAKLELLGATRQQLGDAEQAVIECNLAVQKIEAEIAALRDKVVEKKVVELRDCKTSFDSKIEAYKATYRAAYDRVPSDTQINAMKRRLGITI